MEQIKFDFSGAGALDALKRLEDILDTGHWTFRGLNPGEDITSLLMFLLRQNGISVHRQQFDEKEYTAEIREKAALYANRVRKRDGGASLLPVAALLAGEVPDLTQTDHGALFYPTRKAYVRAGGLAPEKLLDLLAHEGCGAVLLFPVYEQDVFYAFVRNMTRDELLDELKKIEEKRMEAIRDVMSGMEDILPEVQKIEE